MGRIFSILTLLVCCFVTVHGVELIKDGKFTFSGVVVAANAVPSTRLAAKEIVYHLEKVTGEKLPVIAPNAVVSGKKYIFVGHCKKTLHLKAWTLARNNGIIEITDKAIFISGRDRHSHPGTDAYSRGTLFAAYEFLEKFVGVRWIWPGKSGEVIPRHRNLNIPEQKLLTKSHLLSSGWRTSGIENKMAWKNSDNWKRFFEDQKVWLRRHRFASYSNFYQDFRTRLDLIRHCDNMRSGIRQDNESFLQGRQQDQPSDRKCRSVSGAGCSPRFTECRP